MTYSNECTITTIGDVLRVRGRYQLPRGHCVWNLSSIVYGTFFVEPLRMKSFRTKPFNDLEHAIQVQRMGTADLSCRLRTHSSKHVSCLSVLR